MPAKSRTRSESQCSISTGLFVSRREGSIDMLTTISTPASLATRQKIALVFTISGRSGLPTNKAARTSPNAAVTA